jgi:5'-nucleotidase
MRRRQVATLPAILDVTACRVAQCPLGSIVATALRDAVRAPGNMTVIGLMNGGGLRVGLPAGPITLGQVLDTMPFGNTLATTTITGADLIDTVKHGVSMMGRGGYAQWAGLRVNLPGLDIEVEHAGTWAPVDPNAAYLIATNNFVRTGGDGYTTLRDRGQNPYDNGDNLAELLAGALAREFAPKR